MVVGTVNGAKICKLVHIRTVLRIRTAELFGMVVGRGGARGGGGVRGGKRGEDRGRFHLVEFVWGERIGGDGGRGRGRGGRRGIGGGRVGGVGGGDGGGGRGDLPSLRHKNGLIGKRGSGVEGCRGVER